MKKFYVGAIHIGAAISAGQDVPATHNTVEEAVEDAKRKIGKNAADCLVVVEIVRIVRREDPPIVVTIP